MCECEAHNDHCQKIQIVNINLDDASCEEEDQMYL